LFCECDSPHPASSGVHCLPREDEAAVQRTPRHRKFTSSYAPSRVRKALAKGGHLRHIPQCSRLGSPRGRKRAVGTHRQPRSPSVLPSKVQKALFAGSTPPTAHRPLVPGPIPERGKSGRRDSTELPEATSPRPCAPSKVRKALPLGPSTAAASGPLLPIGDRPSGLHDTEPQHTSSRVPLRSAEALAAVIPPQQQAYSFQFPRGRSSHRGLPRTRRNTSGQCPSKVRRHSPP